MDMPISSCQSSFSFIFNFFHVLLRGVVDGVRVTVKDV